MCYTTVQVTFVSRRCRLLFLPQRQTYAGTPSGSRLIVTTWTFCRRRAAGMWNWMFNSINYQGQEQLEIYPNYPPSCHEMVLNLSQEFWVDDELEINCWNISLRLLWSGASHLVLCTRTKVFEESTASISGSKNVFCFTHRDKNSFQNNACSLYKDTRHHIAEDSNFLKLHISKICIGIFLSISFMIFKLSVC